MKSSEKQEKVYLLKSFEINLIDGIDDTNGGFSDLLSVPIYAQDLGVYSSVKKAESHLKKWLKHTEKWEVQFVGFQLIEKSVNVSLGGKFGELCKFQGIRSYDASGKLICDSPYDDGCVKRFKGRNDCKFKSGDIVFTIVSDIEAVPAMVISPPLAHVEGGDYSDDCYHVVQALESEANKTISHFHPSVVDVFDYPGKPSKSLVSKLKQVKKWFQGK